MLRCIFKRRSFGFASSAWLEAPWAGVKKRIEQRIMDQGFKLTSILERTDAIEHHSVSNDAIQKLVRECNAASAHAQRIRKALAGEEDAQKRRDLQNNDSDEHGPGENTLNCLMLQLTAMAVELSLHEAAHTVLDIAQTALATATATAATTTAEDLHLQKATLAVPPPQRQLAALAREIVSGADRLFTQRRGPTLLARLLFPLHTAARHLAVDAADGARCRALLERLHGGGGGDDEGKGAMPSSPPLHPEIDARNFTFVGHAREKAVVAIGALQGAGGRG